MQRTLAFSVEIKTALVEAVQREWGGGRSSWDRAFAAHLIDKIESIPAPSVVTWDAEDLEGIVVGDELQLSPESIVGLAVEYFGTIVPLTPELAREGHEEHDTVWAIAGAPGSGRSLHCRTCQRELWSNVRVLEPWETK